jgi:hypothetical protein
MTFRGRYLLIGRLALAAAVGLIGGNFFGGRGEVLKPDGGRVVTVMDFGQSFPLDPLPLLTTPEILGYGARRIWSIARCSATAMTHTLPASVISPMCGSNGGDARHVYCR